MIGKLIVVDDESWFREGLMMLIGKEQLGWEVVGEASDGEEALALIETTKPDLVITDIRMPVVDGLMLTERLAETHRDIMVIILTGYRDFEYAQHALRNGAIEYLLKPVSLQETCRVLRKAYDRYRQKQVEQKLRLREKQLNILRAALFRLPCNKQEWNEVSSQFSGYELWVLQVENYFPQDRNYEEKDIELLHYAIANIGGELLQSQNQQGILLSLNNWELVFLLAPGEAVQRYCTLVTENINALLHLAVQWHCGGLIQQLEELELRYAQLRGVYLHASNTRLDDKAERSIELRENVLSDLIIGDVEGARKKLIAHIERAASFTLHDCKTEIYILVLALSSLLDTNFKQLQADNSNDLHLESILLLEEKAKITEWALIKTEAFLSRFEQWLQEKRENVVQQAKQYIELHYKESCSLQLVAAHVHVTPNYLSNLFKRETGVAFSNYISMLRIENAKNLLTFTKMRISEIAEHTGFDSASYFTTVFRQVTGKSPTEYRKEDQNARL